MMPATRLIFHLTAALFLASVAALTGALAAGAALLPSDVIALTADAETERDRSAIVLLDVERGLAVSIARHPATDRGAVWSPDGAWLAFFSWRSGDAALYALRMPGGPLYPLTARESLGWLESPVWSPDSTRIAYTVAIGAGQRIMQVNLNGEDSTPQIMMAARGEIINRITWSPAGEMLAFESDTFANAVDIYLLDSSGERSPLTSHPRSDTQPAWSSDGTQVAFVSTRDGNAEIYTANVTTGGERRLTDSPALDAVPVWSPDGDRIAFLSDRAGSIDVYVMDTDGSNIRQITTHPASDIAPAWSPDGRRLLFISARDGGEPAVYVVTVDSSGPPRLLFAPVVPVSQPAWRPQ